MLVLPQAQCAGLLRSQGACDFDGPPPAGQLQRYSFGLGTSEQIICRRCGVYVAMILIDGDRVWSVVNVDTLDDRARFTGQAEARDYSAEDRGQRIARRKARWCPTTLVDWPAPPSG